MISLCTPLLSHARPRDQIKWNPSNVGSPSFLERQPQAQTNCKSIFFYYKLGVIKKHKWVLYIWEVHYVRWGTLCIKWKSEQVKSTVLGDRKPKGNHGDATSFSESHRLVCIHRNLHNQPIFLWDCQRSSGNCKWWKIWQNVERIFYSCSWQYGFGWPLLPATSSSRSSSNTKYGFQESNASIDFLVCSFYKKLIKFKTGPITLEHPV